MSHRDSEGIGSLRRAQVDEHAARLVEHEDVDAAMRQPARPHLATRGLADRVAGVVEDVDQLGAGIGRPHASSKRPPTAASSSGVFTLV
jgi:hypothetical protein